MSSFVLDHLKISGSANTCGVSTTLEFYVFLNATNDNFDSVVRRMMDTLCIELPSYMHSNVRVYMPNQTTNVTNETHHISSWYNAYGETRLMVEIVVEFPSREILNKFKITCPSIYEMWREFL